MKNSLILPALFVASTAFSFCTKTPPPTEAQVATETTAENSIAESEYIIFKERAEIKIKENEITIEKLKQRIASADYSARERLTKKIVEIEGKNNQIRQRVVEYKRNGGTEWDSFKREYDHDMEELDNKVLE